MIAKITKGSRPGAIASYVHGPGRHDEHTHDGMPGGCVIAGNGVRVGARDGAGWARELKRAMASRPMASPVWQASLRTAPGDRLMDDQEWAQIAQEFAEQMGFAEHSWVAVRHGEDHVHIVTTRASYGQVWDDSHDYRRAQRACQQIERDHGLAVAPRTMTRPQDHKLKQGEYHRATRAQRAPERVVLAQRVRACLDAARGLGRRGFETAMSYVGVRAVPNVAATGRMSGYRVGLEGHTDESGEQVWFKLSQLGRDLSWTKIQPLLDGPLPQRPVLLDYSPRRRFETEAAHAQRLQDIGHAAQIEAANHAMGALAGQVQGLDADLHTWWKKHARPFSAGPLPPALPPEPTPAKAERGAAEDAEYRAALEALQAAMPGNAPTRKKPAQKPAQKPAPQHGELDEYRRRINRAGPDQDWGR